MNEWTGDLHDDCYLERYGYSAHVECMAKGVWWFAVDKGTWPESKLLYNTADNQTAVALTTGKMARAAAECVIESFRCHEED
ncbi:MAG: hypothetical protein KOO63_08305 [Bacteroidales bacterium]|nr:hypothetical protein [Candidatus Latescibacterota bacterium]